MVFKLLLGYEEALWPKKIGYKLVQSNFETRASDFGSFLVTNVCKSVLTFIYETGGNDFWLLACCVERVSRLVTPKVTRAGTASGLIQKEIQDIMTIKHVGM